MLFIILYLDNDLIDIIKTRRSIREFKQEEVSLEVLKDIVETGRLAPSPHNIQPWEFIIIKNKENRDTIFNHTGWLFEPDKKSRPTAYIIVLTEEKNLKSVSVIASLGACIENMILAAWSYGIGSCWIGSIKKKKELESFLGIPEDITIFSIIALGYPESLPIVVDIDSIIKPFKKDGKVFVPKKNLERILHLEKF